MTKCKCRIPKVCVPLWSISSCDDRKTANFLPRSIEFSCWLVRKCSFSFSVRIWIDGLEFYCWYVCKSQFMTWIQIIFIFVYFGLKDLMYGAFFEDFSLILQNTCESWARLSTTYLHNYINEEQSFSADFLTFFFKVWTNRFILSFQKNWLRIHFWKALKTHWTCNSTFYKVIEIFSIVQSLILNVIAIIMV